VKILLLIKNIQNMIQISAFSHLKNLFLIGIFSLVANSLLTEIIQIILLKELKISTF
jgi:hypothetical protein